jgi:hypothetical protein
VKGRGWAVPEQVPQPEPAPVMTLTDVANGPEGYFAHQRKRVLRCTQCIGTSGRSRFIWSRCWVRRVSRRWSLRRSSDWVDEQLELGAAPKSIRNRHGLLSSVMTYGQGRLRLRPDNPCTPAHDEVVARPA